MSNKAFAGMQVEFAPGVIRGVRAWQLSLTGQLHGLTFPAVWEPGLNVAVCGRSTYLNPLFGSAVFAGLPAEIFPPHSAPMSECSCGFYAYFGDATPAGLLPVSAAHVFGVIEAHGRVLIGELGFRAEKARIVALCAPHRIFSRYPNIPVFDDVEKMAAEFPPDLSNSVGPPAAPKPEPLPPTSPGLTFYKHSDGHFYSTPPERES